MKESFEWFGDAVLEGVLPILIVTHLNTTQNRTQSSHQCGTLELSNTLLEAAREKILSNSSLATAFEHLGRFCADMLKKLPALISYPAAVN